MVRLTFVAPVAGIALPVARVDHVDVGIDVETAEAAAGDLLRADDRQVLKDWGEDG